MLIQNDGILAIFQLASNATIPRLWNAVLRNAQAFEITFGFRSNHNFTMLQKQEKRICFSWQSIRN